MGRHRRTAPVPPGAPPADAPTGRHRGPRPSGAVRPTVPVRTDSTVRSPATSYPGASSRPDASPRSGAPSRPGGLLRTAPVRTGLLGVSAALAMGAVAVSAGLLPGGAYEPGGADGSGGRIRTGALPEVTSTQGARSPLPADRGTPPADRGAARPDAPGAGSTDDGSAPSADERKGTAGGRATEGGTSGTGSTGSADSSRTDGSPSDRAGDSSAASGGGASTPAPAETRAGKPAPTTGDRRAAARVLTLVNKERVTAGCAPLTADGDLTGLAQSFSEDMARRDFFAHTDPDGATPWDRAKTAGIADLGGENIARGQRTPEAVMESWMNSPGHRANILNCDYRTLGIGIHRSPGGPWWTQDFGF
ncbi:CAP domain-containing protein [Streptomyces olivaceiscleroticus]|uniref:CAP domain-containing protein n=1 Tax=Streptomyces olivaceiscleroticus TaxID=68245 RepID=A0ABN1AP27_9ACTN